MSKEIRYENGNPAKKWTISLPGPGYVVDGDILVTLQSGERLFCKAKYGYAKERLLGKKRHVVNIKFSRVCDGKAVLNVSEGNRKLFSSLSVEFKED
jgi:hypothetical protein